MPKTKSAAPVLAHQGGKKLGQEIKLTTIILPYAAPQINPRAELFTYKPLARTAAAFALRALAVLAAVAALAALNAWAWGGPAWPVPAAGAAAAALARLAGAVECKEVRPCVES